MKGKQLGGSHGRMPEPSQKIVMCGKRMSKPYVPYGMKRYRGGGGGGDIDQQLGQYRPSSGRHSVDITTDNATHNSDLF